MERSGALGLERVTAVVVDFHSGDDLAGCCSSLLDEHCGVVVVDNADIGTAALALGDLCREVTLIETGVNLGFGGGVNRGAAAVATEFLAVCNPDLVVHQGAIAALVGALDHNPHWAIVGPKILDSSGVVYPSVRRFPWM